MGIGSARTLKRRNQSPLYPQPQVLQYDSRAARGRGGSTETLSVTVQNPEGELKPGGGVRDLLKHVGAKRLMGLQAHQA